MTTGEGKKLGVGWRKIVYPTYKGYICTGGDPPFDSAPVLVRIADNDFHLRVVAAVWMEEEEDQNPYWLCFGGRFKLSLRSVKEWCPVPPLLPDEK